jgi:hypothetical protein
MTEEKSPRPFDAALLPSAGLCSTRRRRVESLGTGFVPTLPVSRRAEGGSRLARSATAERLGLDAAEHGGRRFGFLPIGGGEVAGERSDGRRRGQSPGVGVA